MIHTPSTRTILIILGIAAACAYVLFANPHRFHAHYSGGIAPGIAATVHPDGTVTGGCAPDETLTFEERLMLIAVLSGLAGLLIGLGYGVCRVWRRVRGRRVG